MGKIFKKRYVISLILVTIIILLAMLMFQANRDNVTVAENVTGVIVSPVQKLFSTVGNWFAGLGKYFIDLKVLRVENAELKSTIQKLNNDVRDLDGLRNENERLRKMLNLKEAAQNHDIESAEIVAKSAGNWYNNFTIDKGSSHGIERKQPVITSDNALVGYIYELGTNWAKVSGIIDPGTSVGALVVRSRDIGIIEGDVTLMQDGLCKLSFISKNTNIIAGDYIETSGMGGIYPKGILIGQVLEIRPQTHSISQYAIVETAVNFERITEVFVIKNPPEEY